MSRRIFCPEIHCRLKELKNNIVITEYWGSCWSLSILSYCRKMSLYWIEATATVSLLTVIKVIKNQLWQHKHRFLPSRRVGKEQHCGEPPFSTPAEACTAASHWPPPARAQSWAEPTGELSSHGYTNTHTHTQSSEYEILFVTILSGLLAVFQPHDRKLFSRRWGRQSSAPSSVEGVQE